MDTVLFNFHDLVLILTAFECVLFALLIFFAHRGQALSTMLIIGFLLCHALIPLNELTFWGASFRLWMLDITPNLFFIGSYAYFIDGALLYFFVRSLVFRDFKFKPRDAVHLLPLAIYFLYMIFGFYTLPVDEKVRLIDTQHIAYSSPYLYFEFISRVLRLAYCVACVGLISRYSARLQEFYATIDNVDLSWLRIMIWSFFCVYLWEAWLLSLKVYYLQVNHFNLDLLNILGTSDYHATFIVLNILIFLKFTRFTSVVPIKEERRENGKSAAASDVLETDNNEHILLDSKMREEKLFKESNLTLNSLAEKVGMSPRALSHLINHHTQLNFYEFVNHYRIEEAKEMLQDRNNAGMTITEIFYDVGFNSKSVFNTFFKRIVGMTPSEFRRKCAEEKPHTEKPNMF